MELDFAIKTQDELNAYLQTVFETFFHFNEVQRTVSLRKVENFLKDMRKDLYIGVEYPYIDKLYRDAYYHYYSSKLNRYGRDCIRLSFFSSVISITDFHSRGGVQKIQENFMGFLVLRPTPQNVIGRNVLRPDFFTKNGNRYTAVTKTNASINGVKLDVEGFPHSAQDAEFMVCAETTIWSLMEYFSSRYADYTPILPKKIHKTLSSISMQRQVPSVGLTGLEISYALKELGFGVKQYTLGSYGGKIYEEEFHRMIQVYVESGIPLIAAIENDKIGHVINIIGRTEFEVPENFGYTTIECLGSGSQIYDYYELPCKYLSIDDNQPPYSEITLKDPACNYTSKEWKGCQIAAAIVPLYHRIYMEADRAKRLAIQILKAIDKQIPLPTLVLRVLLSSSRSFKNSVSLNPDLDTVTKTLIINIEMPKFVWIAEISTPDLVKEGKATGLILMDATEPKSSEPLAYLLENSYIGTIKGEIGRYPLPLHPFNIHNNLKPF